MFIGKYNTNSVYLNIKYSINIFENGFVEKNKQQKIQLLKIVKVKLLPN